MHTPLRIAIVEDEPAARRRLVQAIAADASLQVVAEFDNGRDALKWLEGQAPDVLLCDLGLPDLPCLTRPAPSQLLQGSAMKRPVPWHLWQVCWIEKKPCCSRTWPEPPQVGQVLGWVPGLAPLP